jgi:hypothetical protein
MNLDIASAITFKEAIELGKYEPDFLAQFPEWKTFDAQIQYQFVIKALHNRRKQLRLQWAELCTQLDFSKKPHLEVAQRKVEQAIRDLNDDEERLIVQYAGS